MDEIVWGLPAQIQVWVIHAPEFMKTHGQDHTAILNEDEQLRSNRFFQQRHADRFTAGRIALRFILAGLLDTHPKSINLVNNERRKLFIGAQHGKTLHFNLSYAGDYILIAIDRDAPVGLDIEQLNTGFEIEPMLTGCFSANEIEFISGVSDNGQHHRFFALWTRKEAILKLTGLGIGDHLPWFEVLDGSQSTEASTIGGRPQQDIHVRSFEMPQGYIGSLATEHRHATIAFHKFDVPLNNL
ncbi:4'-phosphopantetheinyl transferase family protein [Parapedobacter tibetensis]|uniref:4'-phosphopantetheinyl transferase family protein n=1 Tax=Parapedobacter tibetensis TaxID=2972951 RepID=UPI00214D1466|nr:4'-phosphopantetheinyl transferase superfamily protein [Parapedobacter tibetensis]